MSRKLPGVQRGRLYASVAAAMLALVAASPVVAQERPVRFDIPAQTLGSALKAYGTIANQQINFTEDLVRNRTSPPLQGEYTAEQALRRLLQGSGLSVTQTPTGVLSIQPANKQSSLTLASLPATALAQVATPQAPAAAAPGPEPVEFDAIMVTAQKRVENVREVPVSISVIGETQLEDLHATQLTDFAAYVPGFQVDSGGTPGLTTLSLRGIAPLGSGSSVGTYIDDTPVGASHNYAFAVLFGLDMLPYDVQRIEVLRGPQGTLYGANTTGGLLKYVTRDPDLEEFELRAGADVFSIADSDDLGSGGRFGINVPLIEGKLALRASYAQQETPGYIDNVATGEEDQNSFTQESGRVALLWQASEDVSLELTGLWQSIDADDKAVAVSDLALNDIGDGRSNLNRVAEPYEAELAYYAATLNWGLGWADFVSATSYSDTTTSTVFDFSDVFGVLYEPFFGVPAGLSGYQIDIETEKWTQEFRLASPAGGGWNGCWAPSTPRRTPATSSGPAHSPWTARRSR